MSSSETSQSARTKSDIQEQFILVLDSSINHSFISKELNEILLAKDGTLPLASLDRRFPGAHCLIYTNPKTERNRAVEFDEEKKAFLAPSGGWGDKKFTVLYKERREPPPPPKPSITYY